ncbi:palmitoyl-protein thioesterase [Cladophialophora psammophila CBS 110553]|uniref:Palmitoyl-protein thioesterase 1 n=1 Tax=Cladophialophora psammophila CBS 110553 TaxID=1182543 RepID=W9WSJ1_9EURO|nr:palmitoyl-protein thioesterase [Cladophialophora psammophila CBS 110553]EXJ70878.1 palmitoyl-protein thioesterase [Cladophialophora psammophila CBS 110553]
MRFTLLSALLALPAVVVSIVIFPDPEVFQTQPGASLDRLSEHAAHDVQLSPKYAGRRVSQAAKEADREAADELRLTPKIAYLPHTVEKIVEDDWVKVTRLSPKYFSPPKIADDGSDDDQPLPVVIWHGLGDSADAKGIKEVAAMLDNIHPGTYTYIITLGGSPGSADRQASFFGNVTEQVDSVCHILADDNILRTAPAVDAIGFSQGGVFLRGYVERCGNWAPKVRSLITFGSPHNGIAEFQKCASSSDWICQGANALLKSSTVWSDFIQSRLVPAQYYRDTKDFDNYLQHSNYLADINNERTLKNVTYAQNLATLERLVMILFFNDKTLIPKESAWFAEFNQTENSVTPLRSRPIYKEDWIGLKKLDEKGGLRFVSLPGDHMELRAKDLRNLFEVYFGPAGKEFEESLNLVEEPEMRMKLEL